MLRRLPSSPPFPYPTLFRSLHLLLVGGRAVDRRERAADLRGEARIGLTFAQQVFPYRVVGRVEVLKDLLRKGQADADRKSTRLNSSHITISYAVFCLKKKKL